jgi:hypothetical protein
MDLWFDFESMFLCACETIDHMLLYTGVMPAKNDFVRAGRYDLARAVERWGGLYEVRRLYLWDTVSTGCLVVLMCTSRPALEWIATLQLASELGYAVTGSRRTGSSEWQEHISELAATTGLSGREVSGLYHAHVRVSCQDSWPIVQTVNMQGLFELAAKTYAARRSMQGSIDAAEDNALDTVLAASADRLDGANSKPAKSRKVAERPSLSGKPAGAFRAEIDAW